MSAVSIPDAVAISFAGQSDRGMVREENQDSVLHTGTGLGDLLIVADGIGGYAGGGVASRMAVETISSYVSGMPTFFPPEIAIEEAASHANAAIAAAASEPDSPNSHMGTTVVVALLRTDSDRARAPVQALIGHVGDSRAYLLHNGRLARLTRDHSAVQELIDSNLLTEEEAHAHPDASMLTRCLGHEPNVQIQIREVPLEVGDTLLLCSDGLWGYVPEPEIERVLARPALDVEAASQALLDLALSAGGHDNVGIQLARIGVPGVRTVARAPAFTPAPTLVEPASETVRASAFEPVRIFELAPARFSVPEPVRVPAPEPEQPAFLSAAPSPDPSPAPAPAPVPAFRTAPPPVPTPVRVIELSSKTKTNPAHYADSLMLPELIVVPNIESISALKLSVAAMRESVRPQAGFARLAVIFLLAFIASSTLAYVALINGWFSIR